MEDDLALGQSLQKEGLITDVQLKQAVEFQRATGGDLKDILVKLGAIRDHVLTDYIARQEHMHSVDPEAMEIDEELMSKIPKDVIEKHQILPLRSDTGTVLLALSDPNDFQAIDEIQFLTSRPVESALAPRASIRKVINLYYQRKAKGGEAPGAAAPAGADITRAVQALPLETLVRALALTLIDSGKIPADKLLARAASLEGRGAR